MAATLGAYLAVRLPVNLFDRLDARSLREAEHRAGTGLEPIRQIANAVGRLYPDVLRMRGRERVVQRRCAHQHKRETTDRETAAEHGQPRDKPAFGDAHRPDVPPCAVECERQHKQKRQGREREEREPGANPLPGQSRDHKEENAESKRDRGRHEVIEGRDAANGQQHRRELPARIPAGQRRRRNGSVAEREGHRGFRSFKFQQFQVPS